MSEHCRSCNALIRWAHTEKEKRMPLDDKPVSDGNIVLRDRGRYVPPLAVYITKANVSAIAENEPRFKSHFATCPNANKHRRQ